MNKNLVIIDGRVVEKPVLRKAGETDVLNLVIANNNYKNYKEGTVYTPVVLFGGTAKFIANNAQVGDTVSAIGMLEESLTPVYNKDGEKVKNSDGSDIMVKKLRVKVSEVDLYKSNKNRNAEQKTAQTQENNAQQEKAPVAEEADNNAIELDQGLDTSDLDLDIDEILDGNFF